jgi:DHA2 family multidrug resistance protein
MLADKGVLGLMYKNLIREATMLAFNDTFFVMSVMMLCLVPFVFIMRKGNETKIGAVH